MYSAAITRAKPALVVFLVDQSTSMLDGLAGTPTPRAKVAAAEINRLLVELCLSCAKGDEIRDYFHVAVLGYGDGVTSALAGRLAGRSIVPISDVANHPLRVETVDGSAYQQPVWVDAVADGLTPMCEALDAAHEVVARWVREHPAAFPPVVLNITDGGATDGDPREAAAAIREVTGLDGAALVLNAHLADAPGQPISYPRSERDLDGDPYSQVLFEMSSHLPDALLANARTLGLALPAGARGMCVRADRQRLREFIDIGTPGALTRAVA